MLYDPFENDIMNYFAGIGSSIVVILCGFLFLQCLKEYLAIAKLLLANIPKNKPGQ